MSLVSAGDPSICIGMAGSLIATFAHAVSTTAPNIARWSSSFASRRLARWLVVNLHAGMARGVVAYAKCAAQSVASIRTRDAGTIRLQIAGARADVGLMTGSGARRIKILVRGKLASRAYSRTLDGLAPKLWESWAYVTCSPIGRSDYEFEFILAETGVAAHVYEGLP